MVEYERRADALLSSYNHHAQLYKYFGHCLFTPCPYLAHQCRCIVYIIKDNGAKIENVSRMLGHTNITQTQRYAKVLARSVQDEFDRMAKMIK